MKKLHKHCTYPYEIVKQFIFPSPPHRKQQKGTQNFALSQQIAANNSQQNKKQKPNNIPAIVPALVRAQ